MTSSRRTRALWALGRGVALGCALALLRVDIERLDPRKGAYLSSGDIAVLGAPSETQEVSGEELKALDARVEREFDEYKRTRVDDDATVDDDADGDAVEERAVEAVENEVEDARTPEEETKTLETITETPVKTKLSDDVEILENVTQSPSRVPSTKDDDTLTRNPIKRAVSSVPSFLEPFALRSIEAERSNAFTTEDPRRNRCDPKETDRTLWGAPRALDFVVPLEAEAWPQNCKGRESLCDVLRRVAVNREVLAAVANSAAPGLDTFLDTVMSLKMKNFLIIALDEPLTKRLDKLGVSYYFHADPVMGNHKVSAKKFALIQEFVSVGCSVLLTDTDVTYQQSPFPYLYRDSDVESMSDGFDNDSANGFLQTVDDGSLGQARHRASTFRVGALNSGMWYVSATHASLRLMKIMAHRMATEDLWDQSGYNLELWFASRDAHMTSGATIRIMDPFCFMNSKVMFRIVRHTASLQREKHTPVAMHANYHTDKEHKIQLVHEYYTNKAPISTLECDVGCASGLKSIVELEAAHVSNINDGFIGSKNWKLGKEAASSCKPKRAWDGKIDGLNRTLHLIRAKDRVCTGNTNMKKTAQKICDVLNSKLEVGEQEDVILVVADSQDTGALELLLERGIKKHGLGKRTVVVSDDSEITKISEAAGVATVQKSSKKLSKAALKWYTIHTILRDGRGLVFADPSVVLISNPSDFFYRDSDIETASDGWDDMSAYGYDHVVDDPSMDWSRFLHGGRVASSDAGFFRIAPTHESISLAERLMTRLTAAGEDPVKNGEQDVFNAALFYPSYGDFTSVGVMRRTLNYLCFANSKTVFLFMRKDKTIKTIPMVIDFSYHPREVERMRDTYEYYGALASQDTSALKTIEPKFLKWSIAGRAGRDEGDTAKLCQMKVTPPTKSEIDAHELASSLVKGREWSWAGNKPMKFLGGGELETPWGKGAWSLVKSGDATLDDRAVWADFVGAHHLLKFETPQGGAKNSMFISERCGDGTLIVGRELLTNSM